MATILVIDDDEIQQQIISASLSIADHLSVQVTDPIQVEAKVADLTPDAVILDVNMPGVSGWEVLDWLREQPSMREIPILMVSADDAVESLVRGLRSGADDYVTKPFAPVELLARIEVLLARREKDRIGLKGDLRENPLVEVLQGLAQNEKTGRLEVVHLKKDGFISFDRGHAVSASFTRLSNRSAALAMLELQEGRFYFDPTFDLPAETGGWRQTVQSLLLEAAWLQDEMRGLAAHLPEPGETLEIGSEPDASSSEFSSLPTTALWSRSRRFVDTRLKDLISEEFGSPNEVKLAIAWMVKQGHVTVKGKVPTRSSSSLRSGGEIGARDSRPEATGTVQPSGYEVLEAELLETRPVNLTDLLAAKIRPLMPSHEAPTEIDAEAVANEIGQEVDEVLREVFQAVLEPTTLEGNLIETSSTGRVETSSTGRVETSSTGRVETSSTGRVEPDAEEVDTALREIFQAAVNRGLPLERLTLNWVVDEAAWPAVEKMLTHIPRSLTAEEVSKHRQDIVAKKSGRLELRHESANLAVAFSQLSPGKSVEAFDEATIGVVLWWGWILSRSALAVAVAELQATAPQNARFLLMAQDDQTATIAQDLLAENPRWRVSKDGETSFTSLLEDLCG